MDFKDLKMAEMVCTKMNAWELVLKQSGLKDSTVTRKVHDTGEFFMYLKSKRDTGEKVGWKNINEILMEYLSSGYFSEDNLENLGSIGYRRSIFYNIMKGFNYVYPNEQPIKELTKEEIETLEEISKNKFFRNTTVRGENDVNGSIQTKIIEELGIKIYFDKNNKPYAYSHELAELVGKNHKDVMKSLRLILERFDQRKISPLGKHVDFTMVEDFYEVEKIVGKNKGFSKETTYRVYKDLIINYILGLNGEKYFDFKVDYQSAFNFIEEEHNRLLKKHAELKDNFLRMFNQVVKRNGELHIDLRKEKGKHIIKKPKSK